MWRRASSAALVATAAVLPFELGATLPAGPLRLSSVELFLYATLGLWAMSRVASAGTSWRALLDVRRWPTPLAAAARLAVVLLLSAACAPQFRGAAVKFALRAWGGILLAIAAADLLRAPATMRRTLLALVGGMFVAALAAIAETRLSSIAPLLRPFHDQTFQALGQVRGSGPFQFPNIAAMGLEAAIPLALAVGATAPAGRRRVVAGAAAAVLLAGVVATGSRAGLVTGALAVVAIAPSLRRAVGARLIVPAAGLVVLAAFVLTNGPPAARLRFWNEGQWYRAAIAPAGGPGDRLAGRLPPEGIATELLTVRNQGALTWRHLPPSAVGLAYHWIDPDTGTVLVRDGLRTPLPADLPAGASVTLRATARAPSRPGRYLLWWDMVQEDVAWFSSHGDPGWRQTILVGSPDGAAPPVADPAEALVEPVGQSLPRVQLWRAALRAFRDRPLLGVGPDNFRHLYARYLHLPSADDRLHANSLYFETLADLGLVGLAVGAALILALAAAGRRAIAASGVLGAGVAVALGTFLLHGTLDYFFEFTPTYSMFWLLAGALIALDPLTPEMAS